MTTVLCLSAVDALSDLATRLRSDPGAIIDRLRFLRTHPEGEAAMLAQSYWHANGFAKVKIGESNGIQIRLHIWPAGPNRQGESNPHGHRWEFASWIAVGAGITETYFVRAPADDPEASRYTEYDYGRRDDGLGYLDPIGDAWLWEEPPVERRPGDIYSCPLTVVHAVAPIGDALFATVVVQGPVTERSALVYQLPGRSDDVVQDPIPTPDLARLFAEVESKLGRA